MTHWTIQYFDGVNWLTIPTRRLSSIEEELNGAEKAIFAIPNTDANRAFVLNDHPVRFLFDYVEVYSGILKAVGYSLTELAVTVFNDVYELMQRRVYSGSFAATAANTILGDITGAGSGASFGNTSLGSHGGDTPTGYVEAVRVQMLSTAGTVEKLSMYCYAGSGTANVKCAIFADSGGAPGALLAVTAEVNIDTTPGWHDFDFTSPPSVSANAYYWLAWICDAWIWNKETGGWVAGKHLYTVQSYADDFPDPFGGGTEDYGYKTNIYATLMATADGQCPSTVVSAVKWENVTQFRAATDLAKLLGKDYWGSDGNFNIGVRNSCVLALDFNEGAGASASDLSGHGNNAVLTGALSNFTFGRTDTGNTTRNIGADTKASSRFQASSSGKLFNLQVRCRRTSTSGYIKAALYADNAGAPGALIAESVAINCGTSSAWRTFPFTVGSEPTVANGVYYWLAISSGGSYTYAASDTLTNLEYNSDGYSGGFSDPYGASSSYAEEMCAYANGVSAAPEWVAGKYREAIQLSTGQYIEAASPTDFPVAAAAPFTVSFWVKPTGTPANGAVFLYFTTIGGNGTARGIIRFNSKIYFHGQNVDLQGTLDFSADAWQMITATYDGSTLTLYKNAVACGSGSRALLAGSAHLYIGKQLDAGWQEYLAAIFDEVLIYDRSFTANEVEWLYSQTPRGCHKGTDRTRRRQRVICKGYDGVGNRTTGEAGDGDDVLVASKISSASSASMDESAASLLSQVSDDSLGSSITVPASTGVYFKPGDTVPVHIDKLALDGLYRIKQTSKGSILVTWTLEKSNIELRVVSAAVKETKTEEIASRVGVEFTRCDTPPASPVAGDLWYAPTANTYKWYNGATWTDVNTKDTLLQEADAGISIDTDTGEITAIDTSTGLIIGSVSTNLYTVVDACFAAGYMLVFIKGGNYPWNGTLTSIPAYGRLVASNMGAVRITATASSADAMIKLLNTGAKVENMTLDCDDLAAYGVRIQGATCECIEVEALSATAVGIALDSETSKTGSKLKWCKAKNAPIGIQVLNGNTDVWILGCTTSVENYSLNNSIGMEINASGVQITDPHIWGHDEGLVVADISSVENLTLKGAYIESNVRHNIRLGQHSVRACVFDFIFWTNSAVNTIRTTRAAELTDEIFCDIYTDTPVPNELSYKQERNVFRGTFFGSGSDPNFYQQYAIYRNSYYFQNNNLTGCSFRSTYSIAILGERAASPENWNNYSDPNVLSNIATEQTTGYWSDPALPPVTGRWEGKIAVTYNSRLGEYRLGVFLNDDWRHVNLTDMPTGVGMFPIGGIILWSGKKSDVPDGFALCDGDEASKSIDTGATTGDFTIFVINAGTTCTLTDDTGTATGSPITLAEGLNTITVTAAGTFTLVLRDGATAVVASGTATVTGSPVRSFKTPDLRTKYVKSVTSGEAGGTGSVGVTTGTDATIDYFTLCYIMRIR